MLLYIAEVLRHGERRKCNAKTGPWWLIHLAEDKGGLIDNASLSHFKEEIVTFTGALTDAGEYRYTTEVFSYAVDHFLNKNGLTYTGATEETDLSTLYVRGEKVDDLDACFKHLGL